MNKGYLYVGIVLFACYILQDVLNWQWDYLAAIQADESYKRWSGLALFLYIGLQWSLTLFRTRKSWESQSSVIMEIHKWMGAFSPLVFYIHSAEFGFAYLFVLSLVFFIIKEFLKQTHLGPP